MINNIEAYINAYSKSQLIGFLLTFFLGPLGLFYSNWIAALILCVIALALHATVVIPIICWMLSILISFITVCSYNKKVKTKANLNYLK